MHIGNFVEVKNSTLAAGAKANHLAYLGDATVGERVNYGAGSITANYDGANKHRTVIEADVHIGSNCVLVAPVTIGAGGTVGGGSTITKDTPPGALSVARGKQVSIANWHAAANEERPESSDGLQCAQRPRDGGALSCRVIDCISRCRRLFALVMRLACESRQPAEPSRSAHASDFAKRGC